MRGTHKRSHLTLHLFHLDGVHISLRRSMVLIFHAWCFFSAQGHSQKSPEAKIFLLGSGSAETSTWEAVQFVRWRSNRRALISPRRLLRSTRVVVPSARPPRPAMFPVSQEATEPQGGTREQMAAVHPYRLRGTVGGEAPKRHDRAPVRSCGALLPFFASRSKTCHKSPLLPDPDP